LIKFLEGKFIKSNVLLSSKNISFIFGSSFSYRFLKLDTIILFLKKICPTGIFLNNYLKCNTNSLKLLNIKSFNSQIKQKSKNFCWF
jgi:hypothetical protein